MKRKPDELTELLGTGERAAQADAVRRLASAPVVELIVRLDGRTNQVSLHVIGGQIAPDVAYAMLDGCRELIRRQELEALAQRNGAGESMSPAQ